MAEQVSDRADAPSVDLNEFGEALRLDPYYGDPRRVDALLNIVPKHYTVAIAPYKYLDPPALAKEIGRLQALVKIWMEYYHFLTIYIREIDRVLLDWFQERLREFELPLPCRLFPTAPDTTLHYLELEVSRRIHQWPIMRPATEGKSSPWRGMEYLPREAAKDAKIREAFERDYEQWLQKPFWLLHVAIRVLLGSWFAPATMLLPDTSMDSPEPNRLSRAGLPWLPGHREIYRQAISAIKIGQLALFDPTETVGKTIQQLQDIGFNISVAPREFLSWALASKLPMPPTLAAHASAYARISDAPIDSSINRESELTHPTESEGYPPPPQLTDMRNTTELHGAVGENNLPPKTIEADMPREEREDLILKLGIQIAKLQDENKRLEQENATLHAKINELEKAKNKLEKTNKRLLRRAKDTGKHFCDKRANIMMGALYSLHNHREEYDAELKKQINGINTKGINCDALTEVVYEYWDYLQERYTKLFDVRRKPKGGKEKPIKRSNPKKETILNLLEKVVRHGQETPLKSASAPVNTERKESPPE
jgi:hypothetical protein